ncbi:pilus assembly protein CpaB [Escherichia coli]
MNHRMLFFLSVIVITVGLAGIFMQKSETIPSSIAPTKTPAKTIVVAEATRELKPGHILVPGDYKISTFQINKDEKDIRDISSLGTRNLNGYLMRNNISQFSSILPEAVESPSSETFLVHSLGPDELPYGYPVRPEDEYLLTSLSAGDKVSLYIRLTEVEKDKETKVGFVPEGSRQADKEMKKYVLSKLSEPLSILQIDKDKKVKSSGRSYGQAQPVGTIVLRMNRKQLADLRVVEEVGDILLFPAANGQGNVKVRMDDVLPQFRSVKELRGHK